MNTVRLVVPALLAALVTSGCLMHRGPVELERLLQERGRVYRETAFKAEPADGEKSLEELRDTIEYWRVLKRDGAPRWKGVLEPSPPDLYERLLDRIDDRPERITLVAYQYDAVGIDALTLVDYLDADGAVIGFDYTPYPEAPVRGGGPTFLGYDDMRWWEWAQLVIDVPIYLAIGVKEFAGEIAKTPLSFVEGGWHGLVFEKRMPFAPLCFERAGLAVAEDWANAWTALSWRFRVRSRHTPLDTLRELAGMAPVVGPALDLKSPPPDIAPAPTELILVSQGIHCDGPTEQHTGAWEDAVREMRPDAPVRFSPYRFGSVTDVAWSLLNISSGFGYELAREVVFDAGVRRGQAVELVGFSAGAQRALTASRALRNAGVSVNRIVGIAGPVSSFSTAKESHLLLGSNGIIDPVVSSAHFMDVVLPFPSNVQRHTVPDAGAHHGPYLPHPATRAPFVGYAKALEMVMTGDREASENAAEKLPGNQIDRGPERE